MRHKIHALVALISTLFYRFKDNGKRSSQVHDHVNRRLDPHTVFPVYLRLGWNAALCWTAEK